MVTPAHLRMSLTQLMVQKSWWTLLSLISMKNASPTSNDSAVLDLPETDPCDEPGIDAVPMYLWHLGANLTDSEGPSDQR